MIRASLSFILCMFCVSVFAQKPDFVRTPNGPNTIVDWNVKFKSLIVPHGSTPAINYGSQDSTGQIFVRVTPGDTSLYFRVGGLKWMKAGGSSSSGSGTVIRIPFTTTSGTPSLTISNYNVNYSGTVGNKPIIAIYDNGPPYVEDVQTPAQITYASNDTTQNITSIKFDFPVATTGYILLSSGGSGTGGLTSFNGRTTPAINLTSADVTGALTYSPLSTIAGITAGGDLAGSTYPNPLVNTINGITKSFFDPTSSIQGQINGKQATGNYLIGLNGDGTATGPGNATFTLTPVNSNIGSFGDASHTITGVFNGKGLGTSFTSNLIQIAESQVTNLPFDLANRVQYSDIRNAANFGITGSLADVAHYFNTGGDNTYTITGWVNLLPTSTQSVTMQISFTDNHLVSKTKTMIIYGTGTGTLMSAIDDYSLEMFTCRVANGTTVQVSTTVSGGGSIIYETGAYIHKVQGN